MTYTHFTTDELVMIEFYFHQNIPVAKIAAYLNRTLTPIYKVINFWKEGHTALKYYQQYKRNKGRCGRKEIVLPEEQQEYIENKVSQKWTPDVIIGREEKPIHCSARTLYHQFKEKIFDETTLPMKGKRKPNGHKERRGKQSSKRNITERAKDHPQFKEESGHIEGVHHKSAVITLVGRLSKVIIALKPNGRKASDIEEAMNHWFQAIPRNLFRSITFDCGK